MFLKPSNNAQNTATAAVKPGQQPPARKAVPSVISVDMNILGNIMSDGIIDFDGNIDGNIRCHSLVLRHNGRVNGEVHADTVQIYGKVKGLIKARSVHLHATCCVEGIIMHEAICIEDGAAIDGKIKRTNKVTSQTLPTVAIEDFEEKPLELDDEPGEVSHPKVLENLRLIAG